MKFNIDFHLNNLEKSKLKNYHSSVEEAMDILWDSKEGENQWVQRPMSIRDDEMEELIMTALAAQDTCGIFLVIGEKNDILGAKAVIDAIGTKLGTAPEIEFIDEAISSVELRKTLEKIRHYEINACVISKLGEKKELLGVYAILREYMENRYGKDIAPRRIMVITEKESSSLGSRALSTGSGVFNFFSMGEGTYSIMDPFSLFIMAVAGVDIKRFMAGCEVMATDSLWDIDGGDLALLRKVLAEEGFVATTISYTQRNFAPMAQWIQMIYGQDSKSQLLPSFVVDESSGYKGNISNMKSIKDKSLNIYVGTGAMEEDALLPQQEAMILGITSINQLKESTIEEERISLGRISNNTVELRLDLADSFLLGQFVYYILMTGAIASLI